MAHEGYGIGAVSRMSGVSPRALRLYEEAGLIAPRRMANGYRRYMSSDLDRLQEILLLRRAGVPLSRIAECLCAEPSERAGFLIKHLERLRRERDEIDRLIETVEATLRCEREGVAMSDREKFEGMKRAMAESNEEAHGMEARVRYGDVAVDTSAQKVMGLGPAEFERWRQLEEEIRTDVERAVESGADPEGELGAHLCALHREWLGYTWPSYSPAAHRGLAEMYMRDDRFRAYYDRRLAGCAAWLRDAIDAHAR
ncbi:MAG: MerR family transcriptional regulator [Collinsella phocaeensis]